MTLLKTLGLMVLTVAVGTAGGALATFVNLPAGWLTGSMIISSALVIAGVPLLMPERIRQVIFVLLGVSMGSAFTPESMTTIIKWPASLVGLTVAVGGVIATGVLFLHKVARWDKPTAFFASVPGAMSYVLALSLRSSADMRLVVAAQMMRLIVLMAILPIIVRATMPMALPIRPPAASPLFGVYAGLAIEIAFGFVLGILFEWLTVPAGLMLGGMLAGATVHLSGTVMGAMPPSILIPSQILLGGFVGLRFKGTDMRLLYYSIPPSFGSFLLAIAVVAVTSFAVSEGLSLPMGQVLVAFAPGGLEAMTILAFVLGVDPAYVGVHQLVRFLGLSLTMPFIAKAYLK